MNFLVLEIFIKKEEKKRLYDKIEFLNGELVDLGGSSKINFHIMKPDLDYGITVNCKDKTEALRVRDYLYAKSGVFVAIHLRERKNSESVRNFIDVYNTKEQFNHFKSFYEEYMKMERQDRYLHFHSLVFNLISESKDIENSLKLIRKYIRLFNNEWTDEGQLRTILVSLKAFKNNPILKNDLESILLRVKKLSGQTNI